MARPSPTADQAARGQPGTAHGGAAPVTVHLVSSDDGLWGDLTARLPHLRWSQHDCINDLIDQVPSSEAAIVVLDTHCTPDLEAAIGHLLGHATALVPVALVEPGEEPAARRLLRSQALFDLLPFGLEAPAMGERLERAGEEALARRALLSGSAPLEAILPVRAASRSGSRPRMIAGAATLLIALVALGVMMWERSQPAGELTVVSATSQTVASSPAHSAAQTRAAAAADRLVETDNELELARRALRDKHYVEPENDSALSHYQAALALSPDSAEARQGVARVNEALLARAENAVAARDFATALRALEASRALNPSHPRLVTLDAQLSQQRREITAGQIQAAIDADNFERATTLLTQAETRHLMSATALAEARESMARRQGSSEVNSLIRLGTERLSQGQLVEPPRDSTKAYLSEALRRASPEQNRAVRRLRDEYQRALAAQWSAAVARRDASGAAGWIKELQASGLSAERIAELTGGEGRTATAAPTPTAAAVPAAPPVGGPALPPPDARGLAPAADSAPPAAPVAAATTPATPPRLTSRLDPTYPTAAERRNVTGWVEINVTISAQGTLRDAHVRASEPAGVFDSAALEAVRHARYAPARAADGSAVDATTMIKIRFELPEGRR